MTAQVFYVHAIEFSTGTTGITQLTNAAPMYGFSDVVEFSSGDVAPMWSGSVQSAPRVPFSSRQCKNLLDLCNPLEAHGTGRSYVCHDGSGGNTDVWYRHGLNYGLRVTDITGSHERFRMTRSFYMWDSITVNQGGLAEISGVLAAGYDGSNPPLVPTAQALDVAQAVSELYTLGPIKINGTAIDGLQGYTWDNNLSPEIIFDQGVPFPTYLGVAAYNPVITARVRNSQLMRTYGTTGTAITSADVYLRRLKASDLVEADGTELHTKFAATAGTIKAGRTDASGITTVTIQLQRPNAATAAFTYDTTAAIT